MKLPEDEFALEMRNHFLETTLQTISALQDDLSFAERFPELCEKWSNEAKGNEFPHLAEQLLKLGRACKTGGFTELPKDTCEKLKSYLQLLKTEGDSEETAKILTRSSEAMADEELKTFLQCRRGSMQFLVPVENVVEISQYRKINALPTTDPKVKGLIGFRGEGTPVFSLEHAGFPATDEKTFFVVCEHLKSFFALEVNGTEDVLSLKASDFQSSSNGTGPQFTTKENKILLLLDIEKLIAT
jgi:chemotaxis signal transduction protein